MPAMVVIPAPSKQAAIAVQEKTQLFAECCPLFADKGQKGPRRNEKSRQGTM